MEVDCIVKISLFLHGCQQVSSLESSDAESILDTRLENEKRYKCQPIYQPNLLNPSK